MYPGPGSRIFADRKYRCVSSPVEESTYLEFPPSYPRPPSLFPRK